jgi:hypothetical protein
MVEEERIIITLEELAEEIMVAVELADKGRMKAPSTAMVPIPASAVYHCKQTDTPQAQIKFSWEVGADQDKETMMWACMVAMAVELY